MAASTSFSIHANRLSTIFNDNTLLNSVCKDIAIDIQEGHLKLCTFVEELGPFMVNKDVSVRETGVTALSSVLSELPEDYLNESELHFIIVFYCDRLKDHHSIIPAVLKGILAIVQMLHLPQDASINIFRAMFDHVQCQSQLLTDRRNIYLIFIKLMKRSLDVLKLMGPDFVYGVISSIDGERDPRNLMLLFNILPDFIKEFPLGHLTEEMFEIISCYFPVDFNPITGDDIGITREDLAQSLAPCLYAIPEFAQFCLPLIADKLSSNIKVAKLDSLHLLCKGAYIFEVDGLKQYLLELWSILKKEIMSGGDIELKTAALKTLNVLIEVISADETVRESFVEKILTDVQKSLCDVQLNLFKSTKNILESIASVNKQTCIQVLRVMVPMCLSQFSTSNFLENKTIIMSTLNTFIKISSDLGFSIKNVPELTWIDIPQLYLDELSKQFTGLKSIIITGLALQKSYLTESQRTFLYNILCSEIETDCDEVRNECYACILAFANLYPGEMLVLIKEKLCVDKDDLEIKTRIHRLEALSVIARISELASEVLPKILTLGNNYNSEVNIAVLKCLHRLVVTRNTNFDIQSFLYNNCNIIEQLISFTQTDELILVSNICQSIVRKLSISEQETVIKKYVILLKNNVSEYVATIIISMLIPLRQDVKVILENNLLENLYNLAINSSNSVTKMISCKVLSTLLNKMDNSEHFLQTLKYFDEKIKNNLNSDSDIDVKKASALLHIWLTKAVVTRGDCNYSECNLDSLSQLLKHCQIGEYVAQEYKILTCKVEDILTEENFCNIKIFYKQRVFQHLLEQNNISIGQSRQNYLIALTYILEEMPIELLYMYLTKLVTLLIESLSLDNGELVLSSLMVLKLLLETNNTIFSDKMQCFIPKLLDLTTYKTMKVRIAALDCLTSYANYPALITNVYKQDVLEKLVAAIDDRKRLVRKAAVTARTRWYLVSAPGGINE